MTLEAVFARIAMLEARIAALEQCADVTRVTDGALIALRADSTGHYVTAAGAGAVAATGPCPFGADQLFVVEMQS